MHCFSWIWWKKKKEFWKKIFRLKDLLDLEILWNFRSIWTCLGNIIRKIRHQLSSLLFPNKFVLLNGIKVRVFFGKNVEKKHLCCHDKNYYYFWKSNISVIKLIADSRNMIKVSKNMNLAINNNNQKLFISVQTENNKNKI